MLPYRIATLLTLLPAVWGLIAPHAASAQTGASSERAAIEVIAIEHRAPERIRQQLAPTLDPRGSIGQIDDKLVIATTAGNLAELKTLIEQQDIAPRRLVISADFNYQTALSNPLSQFSESALEGESVRFSRYDAEQDFAQQSSMALSVPADGTEPRLSPQSSAVPPGPPNGTASRPGPQPPVAVSQTDTALVVSAEVVDGTAVVIIEQLDPDGRSLQYRRDITLSTWHMLDPTSGPPLTAVRVDMLP